MKKFLFVLFGMLFSFGVFAREFTYEYGNQTLTYSVISETEKTCMTTRSSRLQGDVVIPEKAKDGDVEYTVTSIAEYAFDGCSGLTSVTIPNSINSIGSGAFDECSGLAKAEFGSIEHICSIEFGDFRSNPLYYAHNLYINGKEIKELVIPNSVTSIDSFAFIKCSGLTSVAIPNSVTSIGDYAFSGCSGLISVTIPNTITSISQGAFSFCNGLTSVTIPNSVTSIGAEAFDGCKGLTSVTIPNSVTFIGDSAFDSCEGLTSVTISNSVTSIGNYAFYGCSSLISVTIPNSVTSIGEAAFSYCKGLTSVYYGAENPIEGDPNIFPDDTQATLYVPEVAVEKCKQIYPWKNFSKIEAYDFSGIEEIIVDFDSEKPYEVFNLNGVLLGNSVDNLAPGIYILCQGNEVNKIIVK